MIRIGYKYFDYLVDDFGIWQHSKGLEIDKKHGYALDDSARALLLALKLDDRKKIPILLKNVKLCLFEDSNFFDMYQKPLAIKVTEDAYGEGLWALAEYQAIKKDPSFKNYLTEKFSKARSFSSIRGWAYATIASAIFSKSITRYFAEKILSQYSANRKMDWEWPEDILTYANAMMPMALLKAYKKIGEYKYLYASREMLTFLNKRTKYAKMPMAIGSDGWYRKGSKKALYGQQPIDISYQVMANLLAYQITSDESWLNEARIYFSWFWGNNISGAKMVDIKNERCLDGILSDSLSKNSGAESIICFLLAQEEIWPYIQG